MTDTEYTHGIRCVILRGPYTNGDLSRQYEQVVLVGPDVPARHPVRDDAPAVIIGKTTTVMIRPLAPVPPGRRGYMHGGAWVVHSGCYAEWIALFGDDRPVRLHDYTEKPNTY